MKFLIIGLGSMGRRRIRNLLFLNEKDLAGFDVREDRRLGVNIDYGIPVFTSFDEAMQTFNPDTLIISVSPESHMIYAWLGLKYNLSCFIEASVVDAEKILDLSKAAFSSKVVMAPSCTMRYFFGPKKVKEILKSGKLGRVLSINYQTGQYLPDWHPWENINDYYVSKPETGGAREIVAFELTWLNDIFGRPKALACVKKKLTSLPTDIDDIYFCILNYPNNILANIVVDVISRPTVTRELRISCSEGLLVMSSDDNRIRYRSVEDIEWNIIDIPVGKIEKEYINPEEPYINEMKDFIRAVQNKNPVLFPNTLEEDWETLQVLHELENLSDYNFQNK
jgi:predicted dehydrogenase